uniref:Uncharacterized protein n=1 Tax=viral metagenome TaxID=1070528 RepID=A0A6M3JGW4_9ZZZZ
MSKVLQSIGEYCECGGGGYLLVDGELVCQSCGGISSRAKLNGNQFVPLGDEQLRCPECGYLLHDKRPELKIGEQPEDKMVPVPENKRVVPRGTKKVSRKRR